MQIKIFERIGDDGESKAKGAKRALMKGRSE